MLFCQKGLHALWRFCSESPVGTGAKHAIGAVGKLQFPCMEQLRMHIRILFVEIAGTIFDIAKDGMADGRKMCANLMCLSGDQVYF